VRQQVLAQVLELLWERERELLWERERERELLWEQVLVLV
jgi:hypothetical protein